MSQRRSPPLHRCQRVACAREALANPSNMDCINTHDAGTPARTDWVEPPVVREGLRRAGLGDHSARLEGRCDELGVLRDTWGGLSGLWPHELRAGCVERGSV